MPPKRKSLLQPPDEPSPKRLTRSASKSSVTVTDRSPSGGSGRGARARGDAGEEEEEGEEEEDLAVHSGKRDAPRRVGHAVQPEQDSLGKRKRGRPRLSTHVRDEEKENDSPFVVGDPNSADEAEGRDAEVEMDSPLPDPGTPAKRARGRPAKGGVLVQYGRRSGSGSARKAAMRGRGKVIEIPDSDSDAEEEREDEPESPTKGRSRAERSLRSRSAVHTTSPLKSTTAVQTPTKPRGRPPLPRPSPPAPTPPDSEDELLIQRSPPLPNSSSKSNPKSNSTALRTSTTTTTSPARASERKTRPHVEVEVVIDLPSPSARRSARSGGSTPSRRPLGSRPGAQSSPLAGKRPNRTADVEPAQRSPAAGSGTRTRTRHAVEDPDQDDQDDPDAASASLSKPTSPSKPATSSSLPTPLPPHLHPLLRAQQRAILLSLHHALPTPPRTPQFKSTHAAPDADVDADPEPEPEAAADSAVAQLTTLLRGTVERGEGNSCLVLGPQGAGKSRAVDLALQALLPVPSASPPRSSAAPRQHQQGPIVVRLSGLTHPDDRSALREMQRQILHSLGQSHASSISQAVEPAEEDDTAADRTADADANADVDVEAELEPENAPFASLPPLPRPLIVLLSEFDAFCMRPRQALLYVLLDAVQSLRGGSVGVAVVGMTARIDCVNLLEKRVKSRFSHRIIRVTPAQSTVEYVELARAFLAVDLPEQVGELQEEEEWRELWGQSVDAVLSDSAVRTMLRHTWELVHDVRVLQRILTDAVARLDERTPWLSAAVLAKAVAAQRGPDSFPHLAEISLPSLGLLIAVYQVGSAGHDVFTFQQLEHTYRAFARDHSTALGGQNQPPIPREALLAAFDTFVRTRLFTPAALPFAPAMREFNKYRCAAERRQIEDAVKRGGSTGIKKWLKQWTQS